MFKDILISLKFHIKAGILLSFLPYVWNSEGTILSITSSPWHRLKLKTQVYIRMVYFYVQILMFAFGKMSLRVRLQAAAYIYITLISLLLGCDRELDPAPTILVNALIRYEEKILKGLKIKLSFRSKFLAFGAAWSSISCFTVPPLLQLLMTVLYPCVPPLVGYLIIPAFFGEEGCSSGPWLLGESSSPSTSVFLLITRIGIILFEYYLSFSMYVLASLNAVLIMLSGFACLCDYLCMSFETLKNEGQQGQGVWLHRYRSLQVLEAVINDYARKRLLSSFVGPLSGFEIYLCFVSLKLKDYIPWPEFGIFPIIFVDIFLISVICLKTSARVYGLSEMVLNKRRGALFGSFQGEKGGGGMKVRRREFASCSIMKMRFGMNFVETTTPLVVQDFCVRECTSLILLFDSNELSKA